METKSLILRFRGYITLMLVILVGFSLAKTVVAASWPQRPVEFVISAGVGGGADKYARFLVGLNVKSKYINETILPVNKPGGAGAVAMNHVLGQKGNGHMMLITLNSFITTPLFQKLPFTFRNFTPIALLALDNFPLWVHKDSPYKTLDDFIAEAKKQSITVAGTGSKQEDEIVFRAIEKLAGTKPFKYVPYKGGGDVAKSLVGKHAEATVNQVSEAGSFYPEYLRPLVVFQDERLDVKGYENVPTGKEAGLPFSYSMMRAIFAPPGISDEDRNGLVELFRKISKDKGWLAFAEKAGLKTTFITGDKLVKFCEDYEKKHIEIMKSQGWIK
ncbi:MAG: tripartite tricarboxylate transporter substrate-binding protein [Pseudomonadota bacterium]